MNNTTFILTFAGLASAAQIVAFGLLLSKCVNLSEDLKRAKQPEQFYILIQIHDDHKMTFSPRLNVDHLEVQYPDNGQKDVLMLSFRSFPK